MLLITFFAGTINFQDIPGIDVDAVLQGITTTHLEATSRDLLLRRALNFTDIVDVHTHCVPDWYREIVPRTGQNPTPAWNITGHLAFMASQGISRAILAFSTPGANVYPSTLR